MEDQDFLFITLDALRFDVAQDCFRRGETPNFARWFPGGWEKRHSPGSFTFSAHQAFFAGFLPTPANNPKAVRRFAARFGGSETTGPETWTYSESDLVTALRERGFRTICIGGVGFFNKLTNLSCVLPNLFEQSFWETSLGVTDPDSTQNQFELAAQFLTEIPRTQRVFLFINVSAIHQPNRFYLPGAEADNVHTHAAALRYVDSQLPILMKALTTRESVFGIVCSDHGTLYGEEGYVGHRLAHPLVWTVPYAEGKLI